jgi:hypothetical protein
VLPASASFNGWKAKYGGLEVCEAKRLRSLEGGEHAGEEAAADTMLDNAALKEQLVFDVGLRRGDLVPWVRFYLGNRYRIAKFGPSLAFWEIMSS